MNLGEMRLTGNSVASSLSLEDQKMEVNHAGTLGPESLRPHPGKTLGTETKPASPLG